MLLRVDEDDSCERVKNLNKLKNYDAVIISDYNKGFLHYEDIEYLINKYPVSFIDSKKELLTWIRNASFIKINESEFKNNKNTGIISYLLFENK